MQQVSGSAGQALMGRMLGPYRLEALLGRGGMSIVYRAVQTTLDRPVALKLLPAEFARDQVLVSRFLEEARAAAALQHPHIIPIYDSGQAAGHYYIAMRYIEGVPLSRAIPETGFSVTRAVAIVQQLASALDYAHARGIVHRDVSAGNVMLEQGDRVTLMDFGIAQARQGSRLTRAGVAVGTLEYLSPEQARGEVATPQSDVYALGVLTYELLTGQLPFRAADDRGLLLQHLNAPPPSVRRQRPDVPSGIDAALLRCMAKDPRERYASAGAFTASLIAALADTRRSTAVANSTARSPARTAPVAPAAAKGRPASAKRPGSRMYRRRWRWWVLALAVTLALLLVAGVLTQRYGATFTTAAVGTPPDSTATQRALASAGTTVPLATVTRPGTATTTRSAAGSSTSTTPASAAIVHPASPTEAVQGYYSAIFTSITDKNSSKLALAYSYLSSQAQAQLPFVQFTQRYAPDTGIEWSWSAASLADAGQSATVPAQVTEHRGGTAVHSSLVWSAVKTPDGWRLLGSIEQTQPAQSDQQGPPPGHPGHGKGRDKGD